MIKGYCFCLLGRRHSILLDFCRCESEALRCIRYGLWPSSPTSPLVAFVLPLMQLQRIMQLEAQVSTKTFCSAMNHLQPQLIAGDEVIFT